MSFRRNTTFDKLHILGPLTDKRIDHYILQGRYGDEARLRAEQRLKNKRALNNTLRQRLSSYA